MLSTAGVGGLDSREDIHPMLYPCLFVWSPAWLRLVLGLCVFVGDSLTRRRPWRRRSYRHGYKTTRGRNGDCMTERYEVAPSEWIRVCRDCTMDCSRNGMGPYLAAYLGLDLLTDLSLFGLVAQRITNVYVNIYDACLLTMSFHHVRRVRPGQMNVAILARASTHDVAVLAALLWM